MLGVEVTKKIINFKKTTLRERKLFSPPHLVFSECDLNIQWFFFFFTPWDRGMDRIVLPFPLKASWGYLVVGVRVLATAQPCGLHCREPYR